MGRKDSKSRIFFSDPERFADLVNGICFGGEEILHADDLSDVDPHPGERTRDVVKMASFGVGFAIVGEESQETVDYELPVRILESDLQDYKRQVRTIQKELRCKIREKAPDMKDLAPGERLYHYPKDAKIIPVVTIVLSNAETWDGPRDLTDMLDTDHVPKALLPFISGYRINIVELPKLTKEVTSRFRMDVRQVMDVLRCMWNSEELEQLLEGNDDYRELDEEAFGLMQEYVDIGKHGFTIEKGGTLNMRNAFDQIIEKHEKIGEEREAEKNRENLRKIVTKLLRKGTEPETVSECTGIPLDEVMEIEKGLLQEA